MEWTLIGLLAAAFFSLVGLSARQMSELRADLRHLRTEMSNGFDRVDRRFDELERRFDAHLQHGHPVG